MANMFETITGHCYKCKKDTQWKPTLIFFKNNRIHPQKTFLDGTNVEDYTTIDKAVICTECGNTVPWNQWQRYQKDGRIVNSYCL